MAGGGVSIGGDIIRAVGGRTISSSEDLASAISSRKPGETVTLSLLRANGSGGWEPKSVKVTLGNRPSQNVFPNSQSPEG